MPCGIWCLPIKIINDDVLCKVSKCLIIVIIIHVHVVKERHVLIISLRLREKCLVSLGRL